MWIIYILGGLFILMILWKTGFLPELLVLLSVCLFIGFVGALISWLSVKDGDIGFKIGVIVGTIIYAIYCILRIADPSIEVSFFEDGTTETVSERSRGIIGLIVLIAVVLYSIFS